MVSQAQIIDLQAEGYWEELLDTTQPAIVVKDWVAAGGLGEWGRGPLEPATPLQGPLPPNSRGCDNMGHRFSGEGGNLPPLLSLNVDKLFWFVFQHPSAIQTSFSAELVLVPRVQSGPSGTVLGIRTFKRVISLQPPGFLICKMGSLVVPADRVNFR